MRLRGISGVCSLTRPDPELAPRGDISATVASSGAGEDARVMFGEEGAVSAAGMVMVLPLRSASLVLGMNVMGGAGGTGVAPARVDATLAARAKAAILAATDVVPAVKSMGAPATTVAGAMDVAVAAPANAVPATPATAMPGPEPTASVPAVTDPAAGTSSCALATLPPLFKLKVLPAISHVLGVLEDILRHGPANRSSANGLPPVTMPTL